MAGMKQPTTRHHAPPPQPTTLGAALFAGVVSFPIGVVLILMDLLLF
ncbi:MAG: hypothetical protein KC448_00915 [Yoonia sp.]|nr:hypothetical protein [Yoonia sp.]